MNSSGRSRRSRRAVGGDAQLGVRAVGEQRDPVVVVDRPAVVGVGQAVVPQLGALVDVRARPGIGQREQLGGEAVAAAGRVERGDQAVDAPRAPRRSRTPRRRRRAPRASYAASGSVQVVWSPASRIAFSAYWCRRSRRRRPGADDRLPQQRAEAGVGQRRQREQPVERGLPRRRGARRARRSGPGCPRCAWCRGSSSSSSRRASRAAARPSPRGSRPGRRAKCAGSPPTSLSEVSRE